METQLGRSEEMMTQNIFLTKTSKIIVKPLPASQLALTAICFHSMDAAQIDTK